MVSKTIITPLSQPRRNLVYTLKGSSIDKMARKHANRTGAGGETKKQTPNHHTLEPSLKTPQLLKYKCIRCGHTWTARIEKPIVCPKCKSPYWNKPKRKVKQK